jgi:hypothetical protein
MKKKSKKTLKIGGIERIVKSSELFGATESGSTVFYCETFKRMAKRHVASDSQQLGSITGEAFACHALSIEFGYVIDVRTLSRPRVILIEGKNGEYQLSAKWEAQVYLGSSVPERLDKVYYFAELPPEASKARGRKAKERALEGFVRGLLKNENEAKAKKAVRKGEKKRAEAEKKFNPEGDYRKPTAEDYRKHARVLEGLLRKKSPRYSKADKKLRREAFEMYLADCIACTGELPRLNPDAMRRLLLNPEFYRLMEKATRNTGSPVDKLEWEVALGWFLKGYRCMTPPKLREALVAALGDKSIAEPGSIRKRTKRLGLPQFVTDGRPKKSC